MKKVLLACSLLLFVFNLSAQPDMMFESSDTYRPLDGIVENKINKEERVLPYPKLREADIFWQKRIWRVIDTREKMNLPFRYPEAPLVNILIEGIKDGSITAYSTLDDKFTTPMSYDELSLQLYSRDTVEIFNPEIYTSEYRIVENEFNPEDINFYRLKEMWYFDSNTSTLKVRILGIAPIIEDRDDNGEVRFQRPMFWIYYPDCREYLAQFDVFSPWTDKQVMSWEDHLEMRFFSSHITKESNVYDRKLESYLSGTDLLYEGEKIRMEIFNFEHDLWSY